MIQVTGAKGEACCAEAVLRAGVGRGARLRQKPEPGGVRPAAKENFKIT